PVHTGRNLLVPEHLNALHSKSVANGTNVARKPSQATTLSPSGGLTILSNEIGQPEDCPMTTRTGENELREVPLWRACDSGSSGVVDMSTATRRTLSCACAVKGNAAAARYTYMSAGRGDRRSTFWEPPHRRESIPCR